MGALLRWLYGRDIPDRADDAELQVAQLEHRYGVRLPEDFRRYLIDAPRLETTDDEDTSWWPLERVCSIPDEYEHPVSPTIAAEAGTYLLFADYLIWCWAWAICCSEGPNRGKVALIGGESDGFVADSFADFARGYLDDPGEMANKQPEAEAAG